MCLSKLNKSRGGVRVQPAAYRGGDGAQSAPHSTPESRRVSVSGPGAASAGHTPQRHSLASPHHAHPSQPFNPLIYGHDVDSVDVATRVAMVSAIYFGTKSKDRRKK